MQRKPNIKNELLMIKVAKPAGFTNVFVCIKPGDEF